MNGVPSPCSGVKEVAPPELVKIVACGCSGDNPCSRKNCSCTAASLSCTSFCKCLGHDHCANHFTKSVDNESDSDASYSALQASIDAVQADVNQNESDADAAIAFALSRGHSHWIMRRKQLCRRRVRLSARLRRKALC